MADAAPLRLLAQDPEDLVVLSAAIQDAVGTVGDIVYEPKARRLTLAFNRYRWETGRRQRVRAALQLAGVLNVQVRNIRRDAPRAVVEFLAIGFEPGETPGGVVSISFAGGGEIRAVVECIEAIFADVSQPWPTPRTPAHDA